MNENVRNKPKLKKYKILLVSVFLFLVIVVLYFIGARIAERFHPAVLALPNSAAEIKTYDAFYPGDVLFVMKAKIEQEAFVEYVDKLGFLPIEKTLAEKVYWITSIGVRGPHRNIDWWDPTIEMKNTYYYPKYNASHGILLKYEEGYVYYMETSLLSWI
ncbi:MAG: hypothetical protein ACYSUT_10330 [Planctomycetota bacterium]|jgi:hypothetical protein